MENVNILNNSKISFRKLSMVLFLACSMILTSCGEDPDDNGPAEPQPVNLLSLTANNQDLSNGDENIARELEIVMVFSNSLDTDAFNSALSFSSADGDVATDVSFTESNTTVTISNSEPLDYLTEYNITVASGVLGAEGGELGTAIDISFTTVDATLFSGGEGTEADPYRIEDVADLELINSYLDAHFIQIADIDLTGAGGETGWVPLGSVEFPFTGSYNGDGFTISNVEITNLVADGVNEVGLFGVVDGGDLSNMNVAATNTGITGTQGTGILIGQLRTGTVTRCHTSGFVSGDTRTGGLIGDMESGTVHQSSSSATVSPERSRAGGLIGIMSDADRENPSATISIVTESFATGNVTSGSARVGALVGSVNIDGTVENSYATGSVTAPNRASAIIGRLDGVLRNTYGTGNVTVTDEDTSSDYPGYVVGQLEETATLEGVYYDSNINLTYNGGSPITEAGTAVEIANLNCGDANATLAGFDFTSVWTCTDGSWPTLAWENE
ncbi:Ig-like domain-containing protein [Marivirga salinae]|uniref:Ig-like domain-containing protein n=1 Tax=Marivirga salinarum TaxID=3059078 RepID=A0AA49JBB1_9BACT|nr:Ig-like domain-containing protein [Marivirga sp. BDSF4-3]WKK74906.2 Ig-like domain-containing protein [Marivirga sp. BDSF4-3]